MNNLKRHLLALLSLCLACSAFTLAQGVRKPNVIFILVDDMGYADLSSYGSKDIRTPNIDRLAKEGVKLTQAYSNGPVCTPTRAALITGRYQQRVGLEWAIPAGVTDPGLPVEETSLARMLKNNGYATALFGKWHLGYKPEFSPNAHGFDEYFGIPSGNVDMYSHKEINGTHSLYEQDKEVFVEGYLTEHLTKRSVDFIKRQKNNPFFLYLAFNAVHWPFQPPNRPDTVRNRETWLTGTRADYIAMMQSVDASVGQVLDTLDQQGIARRHAGRFHQRQRRRTLVGYGAVFQYQRHGVGRRHSRAGSGAMASLAAQGQSVESSRDHDGLDGDDSGSRRCQARTPTRWDKPVTNPAE